MATVEASIFINVRNHTPVHFDISDPRPRGCGVDDELFTFVFNSVLPRRVDCSELVNGKDTREVSSLFGRDRAKY
jgi:hypothetical protein